MPASFTTPTGLAQAAEWAAESGDPLRQGGALAYLAKRLYQVYDQADADRAARPDWYSAAQSTQQAAVSSTARRWSLRAENLAEHEFTDEDRAIVFRAAAKLRTTVADAASDLAGTDFAMPAEIVAVLGQLAEHAPEQAPNPGSPAWIDAERAARVFLTTPRPHTVDDITREPSLAELREVALVFYAVARERGIPATAVTDDALRQLLALDTQDYGPPDGLRRWLVDALRAAGHVVTGEVPPCPALPHGDVDPWQDIVAVTWAHLGQQHPVSSFTYSGTGDGLTGDEHVVDVGLNIVDQLAVVRGAIRLSVVGPQFTIPSQA